MKLKAYDRISAVKYARKWALGRNPAYYNFDNVGGDCTSFVSQCIYAGSKVMNFTPVTGWFFNSVNDRSASWSSVMYLHKFLINNASVGPFAHEADENEVQIGDIIQLGRSDGTFYHSLIVTAVKPVILITAHTNDSLDRPLYTYNYDSIRFLHIDSVRT